MLTRRRVKSCNKDETLDAIKTFRWEFAPTRLSANPSRQPTQTVKTCSGKESDCGPFVWVNEAIHNFHHIDSTTIRSHDCFGFLASVYCLLGNGVLSVAACTISCALS